MSIFRTGSLIRNNVMNTLRAHEAVYMRGAVAVKCRAVLSSTKAEAVGPSDGVVIQTRYRDILISADQFDVQRLGEPRSGDIIALAGRRYTVTTRASDGPSARSAAWTWFDTEETRYRIYVRDFKG